SASATIGRFRRNTHPHQNVDRIQPPRIGPSGYASIVAAVTAATALLRSSSPKTVGRTDRVNGVAKPAARPSSNRAARNEAVVVAAAQAPDPTAKTISAAAKT